MGSKEINSLGNEVRISSAKEKNAIHKSIILEKENEEITEDLRLSRKELDTNKNEFENMVKVMEDMEVKLNSLQNKEDNMNDFIKDSKIKIEEAYLDRDKALLREHT